MNKDYPQKSECLTYRKDITFTVGSLCSSGSSCIYIKSLSYPEVEFKHWFHGHGRLNSDYKTCPWTIRGKIPGIDSTLELQLRRKEGFSNKTLPLFYNSGLFWHWKESLIFTIRAGTTVQNIVMSCLYVCHDRPFSFCLSYILARRKCLFYRLNKGNFI